MTKPKIEMNNKLDEKPVFDQLKAVISIND